jgi:1-acyl-sn-glycerol-3-phosphate acyltransferase
MVCLLLQRYVLRLNYYVEGTEHIAPEGAVIYAVKHQSAWETLALWHILHRPVFVLKKELLDIPIFGWYLRRVDNIVIDRSSGKQAITQIIQQSRDYLAQGRNIVIFPEGTRTAVGAHTRYKAGIGALYETLTPTIIPVALNSGCFWKRNAWVRKAGIVRIRFLPPMPQGLAKEEFMEMLQSTIEEHSIKLIEYA